MKRIKRSEFWLWTKSSETSAALIEKTDPSVSKLRDYWSSVGEKGFSVFYVC